jgi:phosphoglycolate phosphatase
VRYKLAMFDFHGTLADTLPWFFIAVNRMAEKHRFNRIEAGDVEVLRGYSARPIVAHLGVPAWKLPRISIVMRGEWLKTSGKSVLLKASARCYNVCRPRG